MLWGYFKKLVIADRLLPAILVLTGDSAAYSGAYVLVGMFFYTVNLYADFTGGIDITIGIAEAMGITLPENFHRPYFSKFLKEYWRRWHMTMSFWFRDYVFPILRYHTRWSDLTGDDVRHLFRPAADQGPAN